MPTQFAGRTHVECCTIITWYYIVHNNIISYDVCWIPTARDVRTPRVGFVYYTGWPTRPTTPLVCPRKLAYYIKRPSVGWQYCTPRSNCRVSPSVFAYTTYPFSINTVTHPSSERLPSPSLLLPPSPPPSSGKKISKQNDRKTQRSCQAISPWAPFA